MVASAAVDLSTDVFYRQPAPPLSSCNPALPLVPCMTLIRCTLKLRKEMGLGPADLSERRHDSPLGDWYAHLFYQDRKKCLLFAAEQTLLALLAINVNREQIRKLDRLFRDGLFRLLLDEGFQPAEAEPLLVACRSVEYATTTDRSRIGSVNELVKEAQFWLGRMGGPARADVAALNRKLNEIPMKRIGYFHAIEMTRSALENR